MDESAGRPEETGAAPNDTPNVVPDEASDPAAGGTSNAATEAASDPAAGGTSNAATEAASDPAAGDVLEATPADTSDDVEPEQEKAEETHDVIYVGGKPIMTYVNATLTLIKSTPVVTLMARGHRIKQAVDVALTIVKRMSAVGYTIGDVRISSNPMESLDGKSRNISTIEIDIQKSDS